MRLTPRTLGLVVNLARKESELTQQQLADRIRVSRKWLSELENGKGEVKLTLVLDVLTELGYSLEIVKNEK